VKNFDIYSRAAATNQQPPHVSTVYTDNETHHSKSDRKMFSKESSESHNTGL